MFTEKNKFIIKQACEKYHNEEHADFYDGEFSDNYFKRKKKDISRQTKFYYPIIKTSARRVASFVAVITLLALSITIYAGRDKFLQAIENTKEITEPESKEEVPKTLSINTIDGNKIITYKQTFNYSSDEYMHEYYDERENRYDMLDGNMMVGFYLNATDRDLIEEDYENGKTKAMTEKEIKSIAKKQLRMIMPDKYNEFDLNTMLYGAYDDSYSVEFRKYYGKDGFATGERVNMTIHKTGAITKWSVSGIQFMNEFSETMLDGLTMGQLNEYGKERIELKMPGEGANYNATDVHIVKIDGIISLRIFMKNSEEVTELVYYELKK